ncbi:hypothetical protein [Bradyrhizobium erythrophlei]|uniref:Uncharacterized protein n=1 Tax=Bradyrhizobium erythrophlei TaxID=1437360 RepID=A0A1M5M7V3_9BRAD|nr:hypothetical protein [Bradyrhizobium erythrophlei]SHG73029.1 hypothetical protein SAMN05444169_3857 [Bradyrhizobium erythrophlei]
MGEVWSTIGVFALGGVGWVATSFIGSPFRQFYDLRSEVIQKSVLYANVRASAKQDRPEYKSHVELDDADLDRLRKAQEEFRDLAARMRAFALNEPFAVRLVKWCGYDPLKASSALLGVSNTIDTYGLDRAAAAKALEKVLHFRTVE